MPALDLALAELTRQHRAHPLSLRRQPGLVRIIKRKLKKIQYRPPLINGCLAATGLRIESW